MAHVLTSSKRPLFFGKLIFFVENLTISGNGKVRKGLKIVFKSFLSRPALGGLQHLAYIKMSLESLWFHIDILIRYIAVRGVWQVPVCRGWQNCRRSSGCGGVQVKKVGVHHWFFGVIIPSSQKTSLCRCHRLQTGSVRPSDRFNPLGTLWRIYTSWPWKLPS